MQTSPAAGGFRVDGTPLISPDVAQRVLSASKRLEGSRNQASIDPVSKTRQTIRSAGIPSAVAEVRNAWPKVQQLLTDEKDAYVAQARAAQKAQKARTKAEVQRGKEKLRRVHELLIELDCRTDCFDRCGIPKPS